MKKTTAAYQEIKIELKNRNIETIIIISPHNHPSADYFLINCAPEMEINFQDFGFIPSKILIKGDIPLADQIKNSLKETNPLKSLSEPVLDYGSSIPLYLLKNQELENKAIILAPAEKLELEEQINFGANLAPILNKSPKNIAIIASGDLSHRLMRKSPGGYSPKGSKFDNKIIEYLSYPKTAISNILNMDKRLILGASECGLKPIAIMLGILKEKNWQPNIFAYQTDFGVGYLSLEFVLANKSEFKLGKRSNQ